MFQLAPPGVFHVTMTLETLAVKGGTIGRGMASNLAESNDFHATLGIFYMLQICNMGPMALLPLWRKVCWGYFSPWKIWRLRPGLNPWTWVPKASTLPLDHRSRFMKFQFIIDFVTRHY